MRKSILGALCLALVLLAVASPLTAAGNTVLRVVVVQTDNVDGYLKELDNLRALSKKLGGTGTIRVWRARYAGDSAGAIAAAVEYPSLAALAKDEEMFQSNAEYKAVFDRLKGMRKIVSDSIYEELK